MRALPDATKSLLRAIDTQVAAADLVLAGGTALALRIEHRRSADLDFVFPMKRLPRRKIDPLLAALRKKHRVEAASDVAAEHDFIESGLELRDYQQDYVVDGVKLTFFVPDPEALAPQIHSEKGAASLKRVRVATLESLFLMKVAALNSRIATRDLYDLRALIEHHGFSVAAILKATARFGYSPDALKARLIHAVQRREDPGVETLDGANPGFAELRAYFTDAINRLEEATAEKALRERR